MQHKWRIVDVIVFYREKNIQLQLVPPTMPLEALLIPDNLTDSHSDGIDRGTGCNVIFFSLSLSWPHFGYFLLKFSSIR